MRISVCLPLALLRDPDAEGAEAQLLELALGLFVGEPSVSGYQRSARSQSRWFDRRPTIATSPRPCRISSITATLRVPHQPSDDQPPTEWSASSRESSGPFASSSFRTCRWNFRFAARNSRLRRSQAYLPRFGLAIRARISGNASMGQMKAFHSNSSRSSQSSRSSSAGSKALPRRLHKTSRCGGATVEMGSI